MPLPTEKMYNELSEKARVNGEFNCVDKPRSSPLESVY